METLAQLNINDYLSVIKDRVKVKVNKDNTYTIMKSVYTFFRSIENEKFIVVSFQNVETKELKLIKIRKSTNSVCYDGFADKKYIVTDEEKRELKKGYLKKYYNTSLKAKRQQKRAEEKAKAKDRTCPVCGKKFKPSYGKQVVCSEECKKIRQRLLAAEYIRKNKEHLNAVSREYRKNNKDKFKLYAKKYHATEKGKEAFKRYITSEKGKATVKRGIERRKQLNKTSQTEE